MYLLRRLPPEEEELQDRDVQAARDVSNTER
jgi:hypothetical protein